MPTNQGAFSGKSSRSNPPELVLPAKKAAPHTDEEVTPTPLTAPKEVQEAPPAAPPPAPAVPTTPAPASPPSAESASAESADEDSYEYVIVGGGVAAQAAAFEIKALVPDAKAWMS